MKLSYRMKRVCGNVFENGNIVFTSDGNSVICPVGNRVTVFDLLQNSSYSLPFENRKNIKRIAVSNNGKFLISVDIEGHALFINISRRVVLARLSFKRKVYDLKFSPNDEMFAVTFGHGCQIWRSPGIRREFCAMTLMRSISGFHDDAVCLDWSADSCNLMIGSKDLSARVYHNVQSDRMTLTVLSGHRDRLVGAFFSKDGKSAYSVARDGAVFTWTFQMVDWVPRKGESETGPKANNDSEDDMDVDRSDDGIDGRAEESKTKREKSNEQALARKLSRDSEKRQKGSWTLTAREFLWEPHTQVTSVDFNKSTGMLVVGFNRGVFGLYEMPGCTSVHRLSVSSHSLNTACINSTGEWLALGSTRLGQLLVWEWQSETYVLKQQGHLYGISTLDFSSDGQYIATGGEDSKVKLWNASSGFCFVTFSEHVAAVTGIRFVGKGAGKAVLSCSLDGTVRAHDLLRYRNFRTLTTPTPVQFTCLAVDSSGEIVCAGALDPFNIYVWSLQTGRLLDVLSGHEGPIACLDFSLETSTLASGSWDGTMKLWDVYKNNCIETMEHGCDVLAVAFRPDGKEVCAAATNGNIHIWDVEMGTQVGLIEGRRDIVGGRNSADIGGGASANRSKHFNTVVYTADGSCILAAGLSKYACIYSVASGSLIKKFQLSHNRSLEGIADQLRSDQLIDGVSTQNLVVGDSDDEHQAYNPLPGAKVRNAGGDGSRSTRPNIHTTAIRFSPTGREWAAATTQGLQVFSLDDSMQFAPTDLDINITPQAILATTNRQEYGLAVNMALHLGERGTLKAAVDSVPEQSIELVVLSLDVRMLRNILRFLAEEVVSSPHVEYYLKWVWGLIKAHGSILQSDSMPFMESIRALIRAVGTHEKEIMKMCDENFFSLEFLSSQVKSHAVTEEQEGEDEEVEEEQQSKPFLAIEELVSEPVEKVEEDTEKYQQDEKEGEESEDEEVPVPMVEKKKSKLVPRTEDSTDELSVTVLSPLPDKKKKKRKQIEVTDVVIVDEEVAAAPADERESVSVSVGVTGKKVKKSAATKPVIEEEVAAAPADERESVSVSVGVTGKKVKKSAATKPVIEEEVAAAPADERESVSVSVGVTGKKVKKSAATKPVIEEEVAAAPADERESVSVSVGVTGKKVKKSAATKPVIEEEVAAAPADERESVSVSVGVTGKKVKKSAATKPVIEEEVAATPEVPSPLKKSKRTKSVESSGKSSSKRIADPIITEEAIEKTPKKTKKIK